MENQQQSQAEMDEVLDPSTWVRAVLISLTKTMTKTFFTDENYMKTK